MSPHPQHDLNTSGGAAVCRVCLCGETSVPYLGGSNGEPLISPCHCKGTMGLYHRSCLEHWLSTSRTACCEICKFQYEIGRKKRSLYSYIRTRGWTRLSGSRGVCGDVICLLLYTPITIIGVFYSIINIITRIEKLREEKEELTPEDMIDKNRNALELVGFLFVGTFLAVLFFIWFGISWMVHRNQFRKWQKKFEIVYIVDQLEVEETQQYNTMSDSRHPLIRKKIQGFFSRIFPFISTDLNTTQALPMQNPVIGVNPDLVQNFQPRNMREPRLLMNSLSSEQSPSFQDVNLSSPIQYGTPSSDDIISSPLWPHPGSAHLQSQNAEIALPSFRSQLSAMTGNSGRLFCSTPSSTSSSTPICSSSSRSSTTRTSSARSANQSLLIALSASNRLTQNGEEKIYDLPPDCTPVVTNVGGGPGRTPRYLQGNSRISPSGAMTSL